MRALPLAIACPAPGAVQLLYSLLDVNSAAFGTHGEFKICLSVSKGLLPLLARPRPVEVLVALHVGEEFLVALLADQV